MSILLALCLLAGLTPAAVLAEEDAGAEETAYEETAEEVGEEAAEPEEAAEAEAEEEEAGEAEGEANASENEEEAAAAAEEEADASAAEEEAAAAGEEEENASEEEAEAEAAEEVEEEAEEEKEAGIMLLTTSASATYGAFTVETDDGTCSYANNVLTISGGGTYTIAMNGTTSTSSDRIQVTASSAVTITLDSVQITSSSNSPFTINATGNVTIKLSGTNVFTSSAFSYAGLQKTSTANTLTITSAAGDGKTTGSLTATGGGYAAGIGGGSEGAGSYITIAGGTVTATSTANGAGIGGGCEGTGNNITITGGEVTATGGAEGAGIGGGESGNGSYITINGGTITATGGGSDYTGGAGIGGGSYGSGSNITINGGTVTASGNENTNSDGAGIGGGRYASGSDITINGGEVYATGGTNGGAGIGGGNDASGTNIKITGGIVTAIAPKKGAGIGGGNAKPGEVEISGGYITTSSAEGSAIGNGKYGSGSTITITGGYFADSYTDGQTTVYSVTPADGYAVYKNNEESTSSSYHCRVAQRLATPTVLAWSGTTATWGEITNADSYTVQLYKGDTAMGSAVSTTGTSTTFSITDAGSYTFTVTAVGTGDYGNSAESEASAALNFYTVIWSYGDGSQTEVVMSGNTPSNAPTNPTKATDGTYIYTFSNWSPEVGAITDDTTYTAQYSLTYVAPAAGTGYTIDYSAETATAAEGYKIRLNVNDDWNTDTLVVTPSATLYVYRAETEGVSASETTTNTLAERLTAPTVSKVDEVWQGEGGGQITGVTAEMEYSTDGSAWTACTGTTVDNLAAGTYYVRYKATGSAFASEAATVTIESGKTRTYTLTVTAPTFAAVTYGYTQPEAANITITSTGNSAATITGVTVGSTNFTISGSGSTVTAGGTIETWTIQPAANLAAGTYNDTITVTYNNSATVTAAVYFTVNKATPSVTAPSAAADLVYSGNAQNLVTAGSTTGGTMYYSLTGENDWTTSVPTGTSANTYTVYYKVVGDSNYNDTEAASVTVTIAKAASSVTTVPTSASPTYNGTEQALVSAGEASGGTMYYSLTNNGSDWSANIPTGTTAGDYTVYYKVVGDSNHEDYTAGTPISVTIAKATLTPSISGTTSKTYDGTTTASGLTIALTGAVNNESPTATATSYVYNSANVSEATSITAAGIVLDDDWGTNYKLDATTATMTGTITAASLTGDMFTVDTVSVTYNGSEITKTINSSLALDTDYTVAYADNTNVGTATITITGKGNYTGTLTYSFAITAAAQTGVSATGYSGSYDASAHGITVTAEGATVTYSETENGTYAADNPTYTNAGTYTVYYKVTRANYADYTGSETVVINKVTLTPSISGTTSKTYDGSNAADGLTIALTGAVNGEEPSATASFAYDSADAGDRTITANNITLGGTWSTNYALSNTTASIDGTISAKSVTANISGTAEKTYDGTTSASGLSITLDGVITADSSNVTASADSYAYDSANAGSRTVTASGITLSGSAAGNYTLASDTATMSGTINKKEVTATVTAENKTYDGTDTATVSAMVSNGVVSGDSISISGLTGTFADANVGTDKAVTVETESATVSGTNCANYTITYNTTGVTASITKATPATVIFPTASDITYGATLALSELTGGSGDGTFAWTNPDTVPTVTNSGYSVTFTPSDATNYDYSNVTLTQTVYITVEKALSSVNTAPMANALTYTGSAQALVEAGTATGGTMYYSLEQNGNYTTTIPAGTTAGTYTVYYKAVGDDNHEDTAAASVNAEIGKVTLTPTISGATTKIYDGTTDASGLTIELSGAVGSESPTATAASYSYDSANVSEATTITAAGIALGTEWQTNYRLSADTVTTDGSITAATQTGVTATGYSGSYDGSAHGITVTAEGATVTYSETENGTYAADNPSYTDAGTYTVYYKVTKANYDDYTSSETVTISKVTLTPSISGTTSKTYDGSNAADGLTIMLDGAVSSETPSATASFTYDSTDAGDRTITASNIALDSTWSTNYTLSDTTATTSGTITAKSVTASISGTATKIYDGTTTVESGLSITLAGTVDNNDVSASAASYAYDSADAGSRTVTANGITLSGTAAGNYTLSNDTATATGTINKKEVTATVTAENKTYDGTDTATVSAAVSDGIIDGDSISISGLTGTFADANAGTDKTVTVETASATVSGTNYENYTITYNTIGITASITKATPATVTFPTASTITYGATLASSELTGGSGDGTFAWTEPNTVPTVTNSGYSVTFTPSDAANYDYSNVTLTQTVYITVEKALSSVDIAPTANALTYTGSAQALVEAGTATGGTIYYSLEQNGEYTTTIPTGTNAGTYTVYYKVIGDENHSDYTPTSNSVSVTISKATLTPSISGTATKTYDGDTSVTSSLSIELTGVLAADSSNVTASADSYTYDSASAGSKTVTASDITLSGTAAGNYTLVSDTATTTGTITEASLTGDMFSVDTGSMTYTGSAITKTIDSSLTLDTDYTVAYADNTNVGTATIIISGIGNYSDELTYSFTINKADPTYTLPTGLTAIYGDTLANVALTDGWTWDSSTVSVGSVGTKSFSATFMPSDTDNYNNVTEILSVTVAPLSVTVTWSGTSFTYDGTEKTVTAVVANAVGGDTVSLTYEGNTGTAVGSYTARVTAVSDDNYTIVGAAGLEQEWSITAGAGITVTFDANGRSATNMPAQQTGLYYGDKLTEPEDPIADDSDYGFVGWYTDADCTAAWDFESDTVGTEDITLYAKWKQVYFAVGVTVLDSSGNSYAGDATITLMRGSEVIETKSITNGTGQFSEHVEAGMYNVVVSYTDDNDTHTKTALITVDDDATVTVTLPPAGVNSTLTVSDSSETPAVMVGGLDEEAAAVMAELQASGSLAEDVYKVTVTMVVEGSQEADLDSAAADAIKNIAEEVAVGTEGSSTVVDYLDVSVTRQINDNSGEAVSETNTVLEVVVPFVFDGRDNIVVVRHHEGNTEQLQKLTAMPSSYADGTFYLNESTGYIHIYAQKFSVYAVAYTTTETYDITFDDCNGTTAVETTSTDGKLAELPAPADRGGYTFNGWYTAAEGGTQVTTSYVFTKDTTVYAHWTAQATTTGGSGGGSHSYGTSVESADNGAVTVSPANAASGTTVTLTVTPDEGYELANLTVTSGGEEIAVTKVSDTEYTFTMPSSRVTVEATFTEISDTHDDCSSEHFTDVDTEAWYHEYIDYVVDNGLMTGTSATTFEPNTATTRGMIATILHRLESEPTASTVHSFGDVASASYYEQSIAWAEENGIVQGYGDGTFRPDDAITREQLVAILYRYAQYKGCDTTQGGMAIREFDDYGDISDYALEAMAWCVNIGIIQGTDSTTIAPQGNATRAQAAAILTRFIENVMNAG